jgi:integrase
MKAVMKHALKAEMPGTVYREIENPKIEIVAPKWAAEGHLEALLEASSPHLRAWILVSTYTGLRASEMLRQIPPDYGLRPGWVNIGRTKNGTPAFVPLPPAAIEAVEAIMPEHNDAPVFGYETVQGVNSALRRAAKRAEVPYLSTHQIGRHTFAARILGAGHDIKTLKEAGRWKKLQVVDKRYGHLEIRAVHDIMLKVAK